MIVCKSCGLKLGDGESYAMHRTGEPSGECVHPDDPHHWQNDEGWEEDALGVWRFHLWTDDEIRQFNAAQAQREAVGLDDDDYIDSLLDSNTPYT